MSQVPAPLLQRAWYAARFPKFIADSEDEVIGQLTNNSNRGVELEQRDAWRMQIELLKNWLLGRSGTVLLEFNIPRMGLRADAVLVTAGCVIVLEFKVGETAATRAAPMRPTSLPPGIWTTTSTASAVSRIPPTTPSTR